MQAILSLALQSITQPKEVARWLIDLKLSREVMLTAGALVVVLNTLLFGTAMVLDPVEAPWYLGRPAVFGVLQALSLIATVIGLFWGGRVLGGQAHWADISVLVIWMQFLRAAVQLVILILSPVLAGAGGFITSLTFVIGVWIMLNFMDTAHGFSNLLKTLGAVVIGLFGMALVLSFLLILLGVDPTGINANV